MPKHFALAAAITAAFVLSASSAYAQEHIHFDATTHVFRIDTPGETYAFGVNAQSEIQTLYWGSSLAPADPLPTPAAYRSLSGMEEYPVPGT